jgi:hypothetical protein
MGLLFVEFLLGLKFCMLCIGGRGSNLGFHDRRVMGLGTHDS